ATLIYSLSKGLLGASDYYVTMAPGVVASISGNTFAGFSAPTDLAFGTPTVLQGITLTGIWDNIGYNKGLALQFDEPVEAGSGDIVIHNGDGSVFETIKANDTSQVTFESNPGRVEIVPSLPFTIGSQYYVTIAAGAFQDIRGNTLPEVGPSEAIKFTASQWI